MNNYNEVLMKCCFLNEHDMPKSREYTYIYKAPLCVVGDAPLVAFPRYVQNEDGKKLVVTQIFVPFEEVAAFANKLKYVTAFKEDEEE